MKQPYYLLISLILSGFLTHAQVTLSNGFTTDKHHVHALLIGISKYKNINDLEFADKDALAFRDYLISTLQTKADTTNIKVLLNEEAISPNVYVALENLLDHVVEGDKVYIYFSGHGDSENATLFKSGFLLTHETPSHSYYTNSLNIDILNNFVSTLSIKNKAEVVFIVDACHSGNLNTGMTDGASITAKALAKNVADEIRMLSCQPNEVSLEGTQWGNGRGLFSYHLINGLWGLADQQGISDGKVTLNELNIYLSTIVPKEAYPVSQYPAVYGPMNKKIGNVNEIFVALHEKETPPTVSLSVALANSKGYEGKFMKDLSDTQQTNYIAFHKSLAAFHLQGMDMNNANYYLNQLIESGIDENFKNLLKRDLIAKLQEMPQLYINDLLDVTIKGRYKNIQFDKWAAELLLSAELIGHEHQMYPTIISKSYFMNAAHQFSKIADAKSDQTIKQYASATLREVNKALIQDSLVTFYHTLKGAALNKLGGYKAAIKEFDKAIIINSLYPYSYSNKGMALMGLELYQEAISLFDKTIEIDPAYTNAYQYKIEALNKLGRSKEAIQVYQEMINNSEKGPGM